LGEGRRGDEECRLHNCKNGEELGDEWPSPSPTKMKRGKFSFSIQGRKKREGKESDRKNKVADDNFLPREEAEKEKLLLFPPKKKN